MKKTLTFAQRGKATAQQQDTQQEKLQYTKKNRKTNDKLKEKHSSEKFFTGMKHKN